ncbi:MAG: DUF5676 family membrane protein [bacterium]|nr:DUF5676 family membrane protein [bacterium]
MELNKNSFARAAAGTAAIAYAVCAVAVWLWPDFSLQLLGLVAHLVNVEKFAGDVTITPAGVLAGLVQVVLYGYLVAWIFAWLYNRSAKK